MKKHYLLLATAAMIMAGCANDDFIGEDSTAQDGKQAIEFNMQNSALTRAESTKAGADAAGLLSDGSFYVWGEKNEKTAGTSTDVKAENTVFQNYKVKWGGATTANTTLSNTHGWEYVGISPTSSNNLTPKAPGSQTIKYWDVNADDYTFTAVSAVESEINAGTVVIDKALKGSDVYSKGYTITLKNGATTGKIYVADRVNVPQSTLTKNAKDTYGGYVKFTFRNFQTKIRFGFYETVPGYTVEVQNVTFNGSANQTNFGVDGADSFYGMPTGDNTIKYNVTYEDGSAGTTANKVKINVDNSATAADYMQFGGNIFGKALNTESSKPTYDKSGTGSDTYTSILPNPDNASDMTFKISYNLISEDTKEVIKVENKEVVVPVEYCKWKSNYAYTYLFKISDQSADLYPITFDACVVEDETGKQETITEVGGDTKSTSITTFAYDTQNKKIVESSENEYPAGSVIYTTVMEGSSNITLDATTGSANVKLYTVTTTDATKYPVTEKSVAKALNTTTYPVSGTANIVATEATGAEVVTSVPAEDGVGTHSISALKWTDATSTGTTYYAIQYKNTDSKYVYKVVKVVKK